jgi:hypothetical protein
LQFSENGRPSHTPQQFRGRRVYDPEYGWITVDSSYFLPHLEEERQAEKEKKEELPRIPVFVVRSKEHIDDFLPDTSGKTQLFVQKEDNEDINTVYLRQLSMKTGLTAFETYKRVSADIEDKDIQEPATPAVEQPTPASYDSLAEILLPVVEKLNNKLDSIDEGIKSINMDKVLSEIKELRKDDKFGSNRKTCGNQATGQQHST